MDGRTIAMRGAKRAPTMADVAHLAHVSVATVSRVLNGDPGPSQQTRESVLAAMRTLQYKPNRNAQGLRSGRSMLVGVVVPDISNPYFMALARGCEDIAHEHGFSVIVASTDEDPRSEVRELEAILGHGVAHIVLAPTGENEAAQSLLADPSVACVLVDRDIPSTSLSVVLNDDAGAIDSLVRVLVDSGHRSVGVVAGPQTTYTGRVRLDAARAALVRFGLALPDTHTVVGEFLDGFGYAGILQLLQRPDHPTALIACNNVLLQEVIRATRMMRLHIPNDISVVGIAEQQFVELLQPAFTIAQTDPRTIGRLAMKVMLGQGGAQTPVVPQRIVVPTPVVSGESVARLSSWGWVPAQNETTAEPNMASDAPL